MSAKPRTPAEMGVEMIRKGRTSRKAGAIHELKIGLVMEGVESLRKLAVKLTAIMEHPDTEPGAAVKYAVAVSRIYEKISKAAESIPDMIENDAVPPGQIVPTKPHVTPAAPSNLASPITFNILHQHEPKSGRDPSANFRGGSPTHPAEVLLPKVG